MKLLYPRLDWYAHWKLGRYVKLDERQDILVKDRLDHFWAWHRHEELPRYAADLRAIAAADADSIDASTLEAWGQRMGTYGETFVVHGLPGLCALVQTLDDRQVSSIGEQMQEDLRKFADEHVEPDADAQRREEEKHLARQVRRWFGPLNDAQEQTLRAWRDAHPLLGPESLELRRAWRGAFLGVLSHRADPEQCTALEGLMLDPRELRSPATQALFDRSEAQLREALARIIAQSDAEQRAHARKELLQLADDLDELARKRGPGSEDS